MKQDKRLALSLLDVTQFHSTNTNLYRLSGLTEGLSAEQQDQEGKVSESQHSSNDCVVHIHELRSLYRLPFQLQLKVGQSGFWAARGEGDDMRKMKEPVSRFGQVCPLNEPLDAPARGDVAGMPPISGSSR